MKHRICAVPLRTIIPIYAKIQNYKILVNELFSLALIIFRVDSFQCT